MRLLYLAHRVPDRPAKGDKIRAWHEVRALAARHEVHLFALDDQDVWPGANGSSGGSNGSASGAARPAWADEVASATVVPIRGLAPKLRMVGATLRRGSLTAAHFAAPRLRARIADALKARRFDAAVVYSGAVDPLLAGFRPRVLDLVDVDSEKFRLYHERRTVAGLARVGCGLEWPRLRALEKRSSEEADATVVCTDDEAATLRSFASPRRLEVVGNGVDLAAFPFAGPAGRASADLLFVGALDYQANVDACLQLVREILPRVRRSVPAARAVLVGSSPAPALRELAKEDGVELHADVPSVQPFLARATLALLPFRIARGVQNKALEALASGLPLVASRETAKGLEGVEGRHWLAGAGADELAAAAVRALDDAPLRERLAREGRALVESRCAWKGLLDRFVAIVEEVAR
jgi:sugar transferase (PEP-CTERM/EpsH1 system associated)